MCLGNQEVNVSSKPKKDVVPRQKRYADNLLENEDEAVLLAKSVITEELRRQQQGIMTQLVIEKEVNAKFEEAFATEKGKKLKASKGEGSSAAKDGEFEDFLDTDNDATTGFSWSDTDKDDAENSDMDISDDDLIKDMMMQQDLGSVFTDAQTTFVLANLEGNPEVTSYLSSASEVPFGTNVDVQATEIILLELFEDAVDHQVSYHTLPR
ncbi:hypothetical protein Tco_0534510 [Tanacetum coccineum]